MKRRQFLKTSAGLVAATYAPWSTNVFAQDKTPIKVGILHSLSGTMAISETALKNTALMTFEEINAKGGVHGPQDRARSRRSGLQLAAVRREGAPADHARQGRRGVRLLDLGVAQVGVAGIRRAEQSAVLSGAV